MTWNLEVDTGADKLRFDDIKLRIVQAATDIGRLAAPIVAPHLVAYSSVRQVRAMYVSELPREQLMEELSNLQFPHEFAMSIQGVRAVVNSYPPLESGKLVVGKPNIVIADFYEDETWLLTNKVLTS
ncbi:MAG TPA: hypothetical protein VGF75_05660 [Candidatus Saccharimonadales bacterium]|jgi:hypothetical protein